VRLHSLLGQRAVLDDRAAAPAQRGVAPMHFDRQIRITLRSRHRRAEGNAAAQLNSYPAARRVQLAEESVPSSSSKRGDWGAPGYPEQAGCQATVTVAFRFKVSSP